MVYSSRMVTRWIPLVDMATQLGLSQSTLRHQIANKRLKARKIGRDWYVTPDEVERYRVQSKRGTR